MSTEKTTAHQEEVNMREEYLVAGTDGTENTGEAFI
jgi:hypothetical protein